MNETTKQVRAGNSSGKTSALLLASVLAATGEPFPLPTPSTETPTPRPDRREAAAAKRARRAARNLALRGGE